MQYPLGGRESSLASPAQKSLTGQGALQSNSGVATAASEEGSRGTSKIQQHPLGGDIDRRASSIAALRMKARQHEMRIEASRKSQD